MCFKEKEKVQIIFKNYFEDNKIDDHNSIKPNLCIKCVS